MKPLKNSTSLLRNKGVCEILYFFLAAFLLMLFVTRSSFLYPCNDWCDANSYFSVGKALFHGKMPYRDVFDQKGMYLYFLYGLSYLVSHTTFLGVFFLEILLAVFDLLAIQRILSLYVKENTAFWLAPLSLAVVFSSYSFYWGGSAEEICFPFLLWGLFLLLRYFKEDYPSKPVSFKTLFAAGILAGMVANIKFTGLGFFFAYMMCMAFSFLVRKDFWGAVKGCLFFLLGMFLPFLPWLLYFGVQGALYEWYWGYVYVNVFVYSNLNGEGPSLYERVYTLGKQFYWIARQNWISFVFLIPGVLWQLFRKGAKWLERFSIISLCFFLFVGIYVGGSELPYYALPLSVFTVLGFCLLGKLLDRTSIPAGKWLCACSLAASLAVAVGCSMNISYLSEKKEDLFLYKFRDIVLETEDPTLLNINCLDAGLYTVCDIVPTCRWFQTQTILLDYVMEEQEGYIREGKTDYVIARDTYPEVIFEQYELVDEQPWQMGELSFTYYLFRKRGLGA